MRPPASRTGTAAVAPRPVPIGLYLSISVTLPDRIAALLPESRPGVPPHITLVHAQVSPLQLWRVRDAFEGRADSVSLSGLTPFRVGLRGTGDFRTDASAVPVIYLQVADGADQLASIAAAVDAEYGLRRRFAYHPHATLASWRSDAELDQIAAAFADFKDGFEVEAMTFNTAHGTILSPRRITWHQPQTYPFR